MIKFNSSYRYLILNYFYLYINNDNIYIIRYFYLKINNNILYIREYIDIYYIFISNKTKKIKRLYVC